MKRLFKILLIMFMSLFLVSTTNYMTNKPVVEQQQQRQVYELGRHYYDYTPQLAVNKTILDVRFYVTKELNYNTAYSQYRYTYKLTAVSYSTNQGVLTSAWFYGTNIFVNNILQTQQKITINVHTNETLLYTWFDNNESVNYSIFWDDSQYDPRNIR